MDNDGSDDQGRMPQGGRGFNALHIWLVLGAVVIGVLLLQSSDLTGQTENLAYSQLEDKIRNGRVEEVVLYKQTGEIRGKYNTTGEAAGASEFKSFTSTVDSEFYRDFKELAIAHHVKFDVQAPSKLMTLLEYFLPMLLLLLLFYFLFFRQMRGAGGGGILSFGKSRAVRVTRDKSRKTFDDVAGVDEAREEVKEIIEFLKNPEKFQRLGGRLPKGVLLIGPPGTGKTLLAKAIAGEADVPFFSISGSDFVEMFVGVGASRVRDLFEQAKSSSPCIIFLDEIDAVGRKRANDLPGSGMETSQTLNAILVEMDGFTSNDSVIVISATNRPDVLDPALLRPGRFDRRIYVDLPDIRGREEILKVHCKAVKTSDDVDLSVIARMTPMFSGADLENLVNEAALLAVMKERDSVPMASFEEARDKVRFGKERRSRIMDDEDKRATAYHEAGHALLMRMLPHVTPLHKVTIIPRGRALGATMQLPEKDEYSVGRKKILGQIVVSLGGRAAEHLFLDDVTSGAANDLDQATHLARSMVCEWGMSDSVGLVHYSDGDEKKSSIFEQREYSEATAQKIDEEVHRILDEAYKEACALLEKHREDVDLLVEALMEFEMLNRDEVEMVITEQSLDNLRGLRQRAESKGGSEQEPSEDASTEESTERNESSPVIDDNISPLPEGA